MSAVTALALYLIFALGGAGIYFLLPRGESSRPTAGAVLGCAGCVGLLVFLAATSAAPGSPLAFFLFSTIAVAAAARVVTHSKPVYSAVYFVLVVIAVAALLVLQDAEFLAMALIIVYAGAILVTYLFVIMLAHSGGSPVYDRRAREPFLAVVAGFVLMGAIAGKAGELPEPGTTESLAVSQVPQHESASSGGGNTLAIGRSVMTRYVLVLELAGLLLLVSMVGAIALSRKRLPKGESEPARQPLGEVGKQVEPF